jgi:hypothetical protein
MRRLIALVLLVLAAVVVLRRRFARTPALEPPAAEPLALLPAPSFLSVPWTLVEAPATLAELAIRADIVAPLTLDRVDVQETPTQVFVTVLARPQAHDEATEPSGATDTTVMLSRPLGERELIHAPADPPLYP